MIPSYADACLKNKDTINHEWNNWDPYELIPEADENTVMLLSTVSLSGMLCFVIGCLEWVAYRCAYDEKYSLPFEYIDAFWVYVAGLEYAIPNEVTDEDRWEGPMDGPVNLIIGKFYSTIQSFEYGGAAVEAAFPAQVALHVLHDKDSFLEWQSKVLDRLNNYSPSDGSEEDFNPLPQQILDPGFEYDPKQVNKYIKEKLLELDCTSNRFLTSIEKQLTSYVNEL